MWLGMCVAGGLVLVLYVALCVCCMWFGVGVVCDSVCVVAGGLV